MENFYYDVLYIKVIYVFYKEVRTLEILSDTQRIGKS